MPVLLDGRLRRRLAPRPPRRVRHGGAAIVFTEATAVEARGRISPEDLGLWKDEHVEPPAQAEHVLATGQADVVLLARELLRNPRWPLHASQVLGAEGPWPRQYERAKR